MSKKIRLGLGIIIFILLISYLIVSPYIVINKLKSSFKNHDTESITSYIDFLSVKESLKSQFTKSMQSKLTDDEKKGFVQLGEALINGLIDKAVSPEGIALIVDGKDINKMFSSSSEMEIPQDRSTDKVEYKAHYTSVNTFNIEITNYSEKYRTVIIIMKRSGFSWKIKDVLMNIEENQTAQKSQDQVDSLAKLNTTELPSTNSNTNLDLDASTHSLTNLYQELPVYETQIGDDADFLLEQSQENYNLAINFMTPIGKLNILTEVVEDVFATGYERVEKAYKIGNNYVLIVSTGEFGKSCPATTYIVGFNPQSSSVSGSKTFESCSENITTRINGNSLIIKKENEAYVIKDGNVL